MRVLCAVGLCIILCGSVVDVLAVTRATPKTQKSAVHSKRRSQGFSSVPIRAFDSVTGASTSSRRTRAREHESVTTASTSRKTVASAKKPTKKTFVRTAGEVVSPYKKPAWANIMQSKKKDLDNIPLPASGSLKEYIWGSRAATDQSIPGISPAQRVEIEKGAEIQTRMNDLALKFNVRPTREAHDALTSAEHEYAGHIASMAGNGTIPGTQPESTNDGMAMRQRARVRALSADSK